LERNDNDAAPHLSEIRGSASVKMLHRCFYEFPVEVTDIDKDAEIGTSTREREDGRMAGWQDSRA
jgi:hypothetical protein